MPEDTANFVTLMKELHDACASKCGVTATLPASYCMCYSHEVAEPGINGMNWVPERLRRPGHEPIRGLRGPVIYMEHGMETLNGPNLWLIHVPI